MPARTAGPTLLSEFPEESHGRRGALRMRRRVLRDAIPTKSKGSAPTIDVEAGRAFNFAEGATPGPVD